jgi:NTP pyrophosphatase (non-canonical NTP hydrolase)
LDEYQKLAARTLSPLATDGTLLAVTALGLTGEAGEVADLVKKHLGHGHPLDRAKVSAEVGDCLWYVAALCTVLDLDLSAVAEANIEKLRRRYPVGFSTERSLNRAGE